MTERGWIGAEEISKGDKIKSLNGWIAVSNTSLVKLESEITVYNFEVQNTHTYVAGETGLVVHNQCLNPVLTAPIVAALGLPVGASVALVVTAAGAYQLAVVLEDGTTQYIEANALPIALQSVMLMSGLLSGDGDTNNDNTQSQTGSGSASANFTPGDFDPDGDDPDKWKGGTRVDSKTIWNSSSGRGRIDVENPNPSQRPGEVHYQDPSKYPGQKFVYRPSSNVFINKGTGKVAPRAVNNLLSDPKFAKAIEKGLKYLGK